MQVEIVRMAPIDDLFDADKASHDKAVADREGKPYAGSVISIADIEELYESVQSN